MDTGESSGSASVEEGFLKKAVVDAGEYEDLIGLAAAGDIDAIEKLRGLDGAVVAGPMESEPQGVYPSPLESDVDFDTLREDREYSAKLVDDVVDKVCDVNFVPPGAAMLLFVSMCTKRTLFHLFPDGINFKLHQIYNVWEGSHPWVRANILYKMRERLYAEHHRKYCQGFFQMARAHDAKQAEKTEVTDGQRKDSQEN